MYGWARFSPSSISLQVIFYCYCSYFPQCLECLVHQVVLFKPNLRHNTVNDSHVTGRHITSWNLSKGEYWQHTSKPAVLKSTSRLDHSPNTNTTRYQMNTTGVLLTSFCAVHHTEKSNFPEKHKHSRCCSVFSLSVLRKILHFFKERFDK